MKPNEAFTNWYNTEGIRTPVYPVEGQTNHHEEYQRLAYEAGWIAAMQYACQIVDRLEEELRK